MGRISKVIYDQVDNYNTDDANKFYWLQNNLNESNIQEYEEYMLHQRKVRNTNMIDSASKAHVTPKAETCIMGESIRGLVVLAFEFE